LSTEPQFLPAAVQACAMVSGVHPQTLAMPPPAHVSGEEHVPQVNVPEQPFDTVPQFFPTLAHTELIDTGVQPQTLGVPPPAQV
jgi:hypothetical protein